MKSDRKVMLGESASWNITFYMNILTFVFMFLYKRYPFYFLYFIFRSTNCFVVEVYLIHQFQTCHKIDIASVIHSKDVSDWARRLKSITLSLFQLDRSPGNFIPKEIRRSGSTSAEEGHYPLSTEVKEDNTRILTHFEKALK